MRIFQKIGESFFSFFANRAKIWGVDFESRFPSEFVISRHAEERICERVSVKSRKMMKLVVKAWMSNERVSNVNRLEYAKENGIDASRHVYFRSFMGYVWIFGTQYRKNCQTSQKILITVYKIV